MLNVKICFLNVETIKVSFQGSLKNSDTIVFISQHREEFSESKVVDKSDLLEQEACEAYTWVARNATQKLLGNSFTIKEKK